MSVTRCDVLVIGAGLAGTMAARALAQSGVRVVLVDKQRLPRRKVCGCCLNRSALDALQHAGLADLPAQLGAVPLDRMVLATGQRCAHLPLPQGVVVSRTALDAALIDLAIRAGVNYQEGCSGHVLPSVPAPGGLCSRHRVQCDGGCFDAGVVVVADGLGGTSLRDWPTFEPVVSPGSWLGAGCQLPIARSGSSLVPRGELRMLCGKAAYLGAVQLEDGSLDLAAAVNRHAVKDFGGVGRLLQSLVDENARPGGEPLLPSIGDLRWTLTPPLTRKRSTVAAPGLFVVGDAAGYVEPFTGEGMAWALAGGLAAAEVARQWLEQPRLTLVKQWQRRQGKQVRRRQLPCRALAMLLRHPAALRQMVGCLERWPSLARPVTRHVGAARPGDYANPSDPPAAMLRERASA